MKVTLEKDYKAYYTINDLEEARQVIAFMKEDTSKPADYALSAAQHICSRRFPADYVVEILKATAETARNKGEWNAYGASGDKDVWIDFIAKTAYGFIEGGAYLTDIWQLDGEIDITDEMWIRAFAIEGTTLPESLR